MDEPMLRIWMQDTVPPSTAYQQRPGRWVGEPSWPSPHVHESVHPLARYRIGRPDERVEAEEELTIQSPLSVGQFAGKWCSYNAPPDLPYDQREEDGGSLVFDTDPFTERCEILGAPVLELSFTATAWRWLRCGCPTSHPTGAPPESATACSTSPTTTATASPSSWCPANGTR